MIRLKVSQRSLLSPAAASATVFVLSALALTLIYYPDLSREDGIFIGADHLYFISSYLASRRFGTWTDLQTFPFGQGFGVFQHPALLNPFWWIWDLTKSNQLTQFCAIFVLFSGVFTYYVSLRKTSVFFAILAAFLCGMAVFNSITMADYFATGDAQTYFQIGVAYFGCAILLGFGPRSVLWLLSGIALVYFSIMMDWAYAIFLIPFILLSASAAVLTVGGRVNLSIRGWRENRRQAFTLIGVSVVAAAVFLVPVYTAYDSFTLMSLRLWGHAFMPHQTRHSLLIWGGLPGWRAAAFLGWTGLAAAIHHIWRDRSRLLLLSVGLLLIIAVLAFFDNDATGSNVYWPLPALGYFERPLLPLYVILITAAAEDAIPLFAGKYFPKLTAWSDLGAIRPTYLLLLITTAAGAAAFTGLAWAAWPRDINRVVFRKTIEDRQAEQFVKELSLPTPVWPLYSPYFYDGTRNQLIYNCRHIVQSVYQFQCLYMFNRYSVPNAIEYQNIIDIQFPIIQGQMIGSISHSTVDHMHLGTLMKSFGIRYVTVDGHWPSAMKYVKVFDQEVSLIDLGPVQPEDLSINKVLGIPYATEDAIAARIEHSAIVQGDQSLGETRTLSPIDVAEFGYRRGGIAIRARSRGNALLRLPFQFSNCLVLDNLGRNPARLIRVDGAQAALSFAEEANVVVRNDFRFFGQPACRYRDFVEVLRLGLYPVKTMDEITDGYRVPLLMRWYLASRIKKRERLLLEND